MTITSDTNTIAPHDGDLRINVSGSELTFQEVAENPGPSSARYITLSAIKGGYSRDVQVWGRKSGLICARSLGNMNIGYKRDEFTCMIDEDYDNELIYLI